MSTVSWLSCSSSHKERLAYERNGLHSHHKQFRPFLVLCLSGSTLLSLEEESEHRRDCVGGPLQ